MSNESTVRIAAALRDLLAQVELTELPNINIPLFRGDPQREPFPSRVLLTQAYPDVAALLHGLVQHNPQAIEATLQVLTPIAPEAAEDAAIDALANGWPSLRVTATRVLGRLDTAASFHALFNALDTLAAVAGYELSQNRFPGAAIVLHAAQSHPALHTPADYDGEDRMRAQMLIHYLGKHPVAPPDPAHDATVTDLLRAAYLESPEHYIRRYAGDALLNRGAPDDVQFVTWYRTVGHVDFRGDNITAWGATYANDDTETEAIVLSDPWVSVEVGQVFDELDGWDGDAPFEWPLGPDHYGKAGLSGGALLLSLEGATLDAAFVDDPEQRFADHLRASLEAGAFPGLLQRDDEPDSLLAALIATHKPL